MIIDILTQELENRNLSPADFKAVVQRLLDRQVIYRHESNIEADLYDRFIRMEDLVNDYLSVIGITVVSTPKLNFVIAYPPGSDIPGTHTQDTGDDALQRRIKADEAGLMITLRLLYEEKIREGEISDNGCVHVPLETIFTRFASITKKEMPSAENERRSLFNTLKQLRIVEYKDLTNPDQWVGIREIVLYFTLDGVIEAIDMIETENGDPAVDTNVSGADEESS